MKKVISVLFLLVLTQCCFAELALHCGDEHILFFSEHDGSFIAIQEKGMRTRFTSSTLA